MNIVISIGENGTSKVNEYKKIRDKKGKSLVDFVNEYVIVDIETTGLDTNYDEIIEIGAIKIKNNEIVDTYNTLIKPKYEIDEYITELTGITNEMVADAPSIDKVIGNFKEFISDSILVGHNFNFDLNFLYDNSMNILNNPIENNFIDTMRLARFLLKDLKHHRLIDIAKNYNIDSSNSHRAIEDCRITYSCYKALMEEAKNNYSKIDGFYEIFKKKSSFSAKDVITKKIEFDIDNPLYNKICVFTGTLEKMIRKDAMQIVVDSGGICSDTVTKETNYLILGNNDYCPLIKGGKSNKQKKAESLKLQNYDIEIISENTFYDMIDNI